VLDISDNQLKKLRKYINEEMGVYFDDCKMKTVCKRKIGRLLEKSEYKEFEEFFRDLVFNRNSALKQDLVNVFMVNETYFFREKYQFDTLINYVLPEIDQKRDKKEPVNILCAPVSSGEELYSIAIMLMEEGNLIQKRDFLLLGIDIDSDAIAKAREGVFSARSVHKLSDELIEKYFIKTGNQYKVKDVLKRAVNFKIVNITDRPQMEKLGIFDVIFSRNMLIYFDEKSKREVLFTFYSVLKDDGYLFLGHAERVPSDMRIFKSLKLGESFVYKKTADS
jgi:chemotaxis protein methyltransferase CheR